MHTGNGAIAATVDYLRCTWRKDESNDDLYLLLARLARSSCVEITGESDKWAPARLYGYSGHVYKGVYLGSGPQGILLQASGVVADAIARQIPDPDNVSRIDIAYTVWSGTDPTVRVERARDQAVGYKPRQGGRPCKKRYIEGFGDGDTLYLGARGKRSVFARVYDKQRESKEEFYKGATRYELELTDDYARDAFHSIRDCGFGQYSIMSIAAGYWQKKGVTLPDMPDVVVISAYQMPQKEEDCERRMRWIVECVRPALELLRENGYSDAKIVQALDLGEGFVVDYSPEPRKSGRVPRGAPRRGMVVSGLRE